MGARCDLGANFGEMQGHGVGVGLGQHQGRRAVGFGASGGEEIGGFVALVFRLSRPAGLFSPIAVSADLSGQRVRFIGKPDLYRAFSSSVTDRFIDQILEFFS